MTSGASACTCRHASDTSVQFVQFTLAYEADYVTRDGRLVIDDPEVRRKLVEAIDSYTAIYRKGCTPPDSVNWDSTDNNEAFLGQAVVMTANKSLSIPNALKRERPEDYFEEHRDDRMAARPGRRSLPDPEAFRRGVVFKEGRNVDTAKEFVRFLVARGLARPLSRLPGERMLPPMPKLLDAPFWLDPSDRHRMAAAMQVAHDRCPTTTPPSGDWRHTTRVQEKSGQRRSTALPPRASAPSRRSTRRSPGSSRSWRSERAVAWT